MTADFTSGIIPDFTTCPWPPMVRGIVNPQLLAVIAQSGARPPLSVWGNGLYQCTVYQVGDGQMLHLSIKREDRHAVHDWRHLQAIKNEVVGPERVAVEIYPEESRLVDAANEYHLWVFPEGFELPFGLDSYLVSSDAQVMMFNAARERGEHKGRQRRWQHGLPVGVTRNQQEGALDDMHDLNLPPMRMRIPD